LKSNFKERWKKSALLQNKHWELCWLFANVLMRVGKKAAGKKNKFWVGVSNFHLLLCLNIFVLFTSFVKA
jgi:hypothetical protein